MIFRVKSTLLDQDNQALKKGISRKADPFSLWRERRGLNPQPPA